MVSALSLPYHEVAKTPAVTVELCMPAKDVPGSYSVPTTVGIPRTAITNPTIIVDSLAASLMAPGALGAAVVVSGVSTPQLSAVAVIEAGRNRARRRGGGLG